MNANIQKLMRFFLQFLLLISLLISCNDKNKNTVDVSHLNGDFEISRFDVDFYKTTKATLAVVKKKYPLLFPSITSDSIWLSKINDKDEQELFTETQKIFPNLSEEKKQLTALFKHIKYYNPKFKAPNVITLLSNIDYKNRVIYTDSLLLISLDAYLGKKHPFYADYPDYIRENNHKNHLVVDVAEAFIKQQFPPNTNRRFIDRMIYEGKKMYLLDMYLPLVSDKEKIGYTEDKQSWIEANEEQVWRYFIENELLYATSGKLTKRFIENAPFSKFYLAHDNLSPGRVGVWIGWEIVRSYMEHNNVSLQQLIKENTDDLLKKSKYKPKR